MADNYKIEVSIIDLNNGNIENGSGFIDRIERLELDETVLKEYLLEKTGTRNRPWIDQKHAPRKLFHSWSGRRQKCSKQK